MAKAKNTKGGAKGMMFSAVGIFGVLVFLAPGAALIAGIGVIPTLVYWIVDSHMYRGLRLRTIFLFNAAGILPFMTQAAEGMERAVGMINDGTAPMIAMVGAGLGLGILKIAPGVAGFFQEMIQAERSRKVTNQQKKLVEMWGPDIVSEGSDYFQATGQTQKK